MPVYIFDQTNSGSSCPRYLLTSITYLLQHKFYFVVVNERRFKFIQANSQQSKEIGSIAKTKQDSS